MNPVYDLLVTLFAACDASTNAVIVIDLPLGFGVFVGIDSSVSRYCSRKTEVGLPILNIYSRPIWVTKSQNIRLVSVTFSCMQIYESIVLSVLL